MAQKVITYCFIFGIVFLLNSFILQAQDRKCNDCYWIDFKLRDRSLNPIAGASIKVVSEDNQTRNLSSPANGIQGVQFELYKVYTVSIVKKGYTAVNITVDTHLKGKEGKINIYFEQSIIIPLCETPEKTISAKLKYDQPTNHFVTDNSYLLKLKPDEKYTTTELNALCDQMQNASANNTEPQYKDLINQAEKSFGLGDYPKALDLFTQASKIKPGEKYPKDKIVTINIILKNPDQKYKSTIEAADAFYKLKKYSEALDGYKKAAELKPNEKLPKDKIAEINTVLIKNSVTRADMAFQKKDYKTAKEFYLEVLVIDPKHKWAQEQLTEIDKLSGATVDVGNTPKDYNKLMTSFDKFFALKDYVNAKDMCLQALRIKPTEKAPKEKIAEIEKIIAKEPKKYETAIGKKYSLYLNKGNKLFDAKDYDNARPEYNDALSWKPGQKFVLGKLAEIDKLSNETNEKYKTLVAEADKNFNIKNYAKAKDNYLEAAALKPNEQYPKDKLAAIEKTITVEYGIVIKRADDAFNKKEYETAKKEYTLSLTIKANDVHALKQLSEIQKQLDILNKSMSDISNLADFSKMKTKADAENYITQKELTTMQNAQMAKVNQLNHEKKDRKKQMANMNAKYDSKNPLTELYNEIDKYYADKKQKK